MNPEDFEAALAATRNTSVPPGGLDADLLEQAFQLTSSRVPGGATPLDPALLEQAMQAVSQNADPSPATEEEPAKPEPQAATPSTPPARDFSNAAGDLSEEEKAHYAAADDGRVGRADAAAEGLLGGAVNSVLETKDFLFGEPEDEDKSQMRQDFEKSLQATKDQGIIAGVSVSIGQFAAGMYGLGKLTSAAKALPWFGKGLKAVDASLDATRAGWAGVEVAKAATVGAVAFDPHEERLANLIEGGPLSNPVTRYLAADPTDSAAEGRMKAALESIGLDIAIIGTLGAGLKVYKALRNGDAEGASRAAAQGEAEARAAMADEPMPSGAGTPDDPIVLDEVVVPNQLDPEDAIREVDLEAGGLGGTEAPTSPPANMVDDIEVQVAQSPTDAANAAGVDLQGTPTPSTQPAIRLSDENTEEVLRGMEADADAMAAHGGWYEAIEKGHTFGKGEGVPYGKLNQEADLDDFMARVVDTAEERIDALKGGDILTDAKVQRLINQRAQLFNDDPASVIGMLQQSGKMASRMVADMEAGYLVTSRMLQDTYALAQRIKIGDFSEFGGREAATAELKKRLSLASSTYAASRSITANAGRAVRRMRREFKLNPEDVSKLQSMDGDQLVEVISNTNGSSQGLAKAANPTWWGKAVDGLSTLYINGLLSGPKTHFINAVTNAYMVGARPMERILGSAYGAARGDAASNAIFKQSVRQYTYMGTAFREGFDLAKKAFLQGDSVLAPQRSELYRGAAGNMMPPLAWKPWDSTSNVLHNALLVATGRQLPTRTLGFVDELVKQTVYRSKVMARAHMEAAERAAASGLKGEEGKTFMRQHIADKLANAFDDLGRGTDPDAIREANIATFQQELLPRTAGKSLQSLVHNHPELRFVLPFVKTPANVIRYGWKMTPVLNLAQAEYRDMLRGAMGREAQAQAVGQMAMGTLFMGTAAFMVSQGSITGGGPRDYKLRQELVATGWQPYSIVRQNVDGTKTYIPYNRLDPIAIPFGMVADLQDSIAALGEEADERTVLEHVGSAIGALSIGLSKQFRDKTFLTGVSSMLEVLEDPERIGPVGGQMVANFVPFSAGLRQFNPDPHLREARDVVDRIMNTIPGISETLPARYDAFGDPIVTRKGLWSSDEGSPVDSEMVRLGLENGAAPLRVGPQPQAGVDLRDITMEDGRNAYEVYQQYSGHLPNAQRSLKQVVGKIMATKAYQNAPDGDINTKGTKLNILSKPFTQYRRAALQRLKADPVVRQAFMKRRLEVRDAYREMRREKQAAGRPGVGQAFGVELGGVFGAGQ